VSRNKIALEIAVATAALSLWAYSSLNQPPARPSPEVVEPAAVTETKAMVQAHLTRPAHFDTILVRDMPNGHKVICGEVEGEKSPYRFYSIAGTHTLAIRDTENDTDEEWARFNTYYAGLCKD